MAPKNKRLRQSYSQGTADESTEIGDNTSVRAQNQIGAAATKKFPRIYHRSDDTKKVYTRLLTREVLSNRWVDMEALKYVGLHIQITHLMKDVGWPGLLTMNEPSFKDLTLEVLSSFSFSRDDGFQFRIANIKHHMTCDDVAKCFGWPTQDVHNPTKGFETPIWRAITCDPAAIYEPKRAKATKVVSWVYKYILRVLSFTLLGRAESNAVVTHRELWIIHCVHHSIFPDFVSVLGGRLRELVAGKKGALVCGGFITKLAEFQKAFDRTKAGLSPAPSIPGGNMLDRDSLIRMGLMFKDRRCGKISIRRNPRDSVHGGILYILNDDSDSEDADYSEETSTEDIRQDIKDLDTRMAVVEKGVSEVQLLLGSLHSKLDAFFAHQGLQYQQPPPPPPQP